MLVVNDMNQKKKFKWTNTDDPRVDKITRIWFIELVIGFLLFLLLLILGLNAESDDQETFYAKLCAVCFGLFICVPTIIFAFVRARYE